MGMKEIEQEIRESCKKEVDSINLNAERELDNIKKEIEQRVASETRKLEDRNMKEKELERKRILAKANLHIKEQIETKKDLMIEKVFEEAGNMLLKVSDGKKAKILKLLAEECMHGLDNPAVFVDKKYAKLLKGAKPKDIGDFGVQVTSGHITVDNTLSAKLNEIKSNSRHKVAEQLWQD